MLSRLWLDQLTSAMNFGLLACTIILTGICGCDRTPSQKSPSSSPLTSILDQVSARPDFSNAVAEADRELAGDEWVKNPLHQDLSRFRRCEPIVEKILDEVSPKLTRMSVSELMNNLEQLGRNHALTGYVGTVVYAKGNMMIISEIKSRPASERKVLVNWLRNGTPLETDPNGEYLSVDGIARELVPP